jgi:hypothetical protein
MRIKDYDRNVFVNCPFDKTYDPLFRAIVFTVHNCGFIARCALEAGNRDGVRIDKILKIIEQCRFGIHDLSSVEITADSPLPRFNMPYELGVFMGCKSYGGKLHQRKDFLVLDTKPHRYKQLISDLAGYDFPAHHNNVNVVIEIVRDWLSEASSKRIPGPQYHQKRYKKFSQDLPALCKEMHCSPDQIKFVDFYALVSAWIQDENRQLLEEAASVENQESL